ncbi:MAG: hypothetical protein LBM61_03755, partial [Prevotellaceae bacterium]|nr:hypothetical protein [Prevotellaceae bacterium]
MKTSVRTLLSLCLTVVLAIIAVMACSNDPDPTPSPEPPKPEPEVRPALLASIEDSLRAYYYWYDEIPTTASLDYDAETEDFFNSLLAADDGKQGYHYSYIE